MIRELRITVLVENTAGGRDLLAEHGLAFWIEADTQNILFDTGQGLVLAHNAKRLNADLETTDNVVLSHGHYDHTGGLAGSLPCFRHAGVFVHPSAFSARFIRGDNGAGRSVASPIRHAGELRPHVAKMVFTTGRAAVADGVWATGDIPRRTGFEDTGGPFYLDDACTVEDPLIDDQALYIESHKGLIVLLGCAHAGLANTLDYVAELTRRDRIHAVLGGMHLAEASDERIALSQEALHRYDVQLIGPAHCTGRKATMRLWERFPERCVECPTGTRFVFE